MAKSSAEKGVFFLTISKIYFLIGGYCIIYALTRLLGPEGYGMYSAVNAFTAVLDAVILIGTIQAVSKFVSEDEEQAELVKKTALKIQVLFGGSIALAYFLAAPLISSFLQDPSLEPFFRLSSIIVFCYAFYGIYLGYINGRKFFVKQAIIDMVFTTIKASLMIGFAFMAVIYVKGFLEDSSNIELPVSATICGFILAAFIIVIISMIAFRSKSSTKGHFPVKKLLVFQGSIIIFTLIINMLLQADLVLVKKFTDNYFTGIYAAALQLARVPYQAITAVTFVVFPLISEVTFKKDTEKTKIYIHNTLRFSLMILTILVVLFSSTSKGTIFLLYTKTYLESSNVLSIYAFAVMFFALFFIMTTIISGSGRPIISCLAAFGTLILTVGLNYYIIPLYGIIGAAISTTIAMFIGMLITSFIILYLFKGLIKPINAIRISGCAGAIYFISYFYPATGFFWVILKFIILWNAYLIFLFIVRELTLEDMKIFKKLLPWSN